MEAVPLRVEDLTTEQLAAFRRKFDAIDLNHDGVIELREMAAISRVFGYRLTIDELREIFDKRDLDASGTISFEEFVRAMLARRAKNARLAPIRAKFRVYDYKGRGYVTADEAYPVLKRELGFDMNKTEGLIDMFDKNRDYRLSIHEFVAFDAKVQQLKADILKGFHEFDVNGDGRVDLQEMKSVMCPKGFSEDEVQNMFAKFDADGDGALDYIEFARFWDVPVYK